MAPLLPQRESQLAYNFGVRLINATVYRHFRVTELINHFASLPLEIQERMFNDIFEDAKKPHPFRGLSLAHLAQKGGQLWQTRHLDDALRVAEGTEWVLERTELLCGLGSVASRLGREEVVFQALEAAIGLEDPNHRVGCLADLISVLPPDRVEEIMEQAHSDALQIDSALHRWSALVRIAPFLSGERRQEVLREAWRAADPLADEQRPRQLRMIAQYLAADDRIETIRSAFASSTRIADHQKRVEVLADLANDLPTPAERLAALDCLIESCSHLPRGSFLWNLSRVAPVVSEFGGARVVRATIRMICKTARWWP
jgi:hypothetical protein